MWNEVLSGVRIVPVAPPDRRPPATVPTSHAALAAGTVEKYVVGLSVAYCSCPYRYIGGGGGGRLTHNFKIYLPTFLAKPIPCKSIPGEEGNIFLRRARARLHTKRTNGPNCPTTACYL